MEFQSFTQVDSRLFFGAALAGDVHFEALRNVPGTFSPDAGCEFAFHLIKLPISVYRISS